jgi:K+-sensing histidine kinase KdpD
MESKSKSNSKQEIIDAYLNYFEAYTKRNWDKMVDHFANEFTMFGTGIDENSLKKCDTLNFYKREFSQSPIPMKFNIREIEAFELNESAAYVMVLMDMCFMCNEESIQCPNNRTTAIMVKENGKWKVAHGHWSQPAEGQCEGESVPYRILKEQNKILEEKVAERTLEIEKQNAELKTLNDIKTKLLSIISHDLRSPFNAFMGLTEVMIYNFDENLKDPAYFKVRLNLINERAQNLYRVADNLLNWAWTQSEDIKATKKWIYIDDLVKAQLETLDDVARAKDIKFNISMQGRVQVNTDSQILGIIVRNFISNAIKYSYRGGSITISTNVADNKLTISIVDKGIGMGKEKLQKLLNTNSIESNPGTEREKGTGLGIQICKELIEKIDGIFHAESTPDHGTAIGIVIPIS